ncbi:MAG: Gfo/Idh/MocA family oxidoreductase [Cyanobacteria bacterium P01_H01_bin.15]
MATANPVGIGIVGTGFGQKIHIPGFQRHQRTEVRAVYHRDLSKAQAIADQYDIPAAYASIEALLADPRIDAVSISTPPFLRYDFAKQAILAGKPVLFEKPLNLNAGQTKELYHLAAQQGVVTVVDFEFRFVPSWQLLAEYLQQGAIGTPRLIKIDWLAGSRANPQRGWNWYAQKDKGGGALGAIGSHAFDYIAWLFGPIKRLCAQLSTSIPERPDAGGVMRPVDADDTCNFLMELKGGIPCQMNLSSVAYAARGHWVEIYGDHGTLVLGSSNPNDYVHGFSLLFAPAGEALQPVPVPERLEFPEVYADGRLAPFIRVCDRFVESVDAEESLTPSLTEGVYSQLLMDLTHESHANQRWVEVPDLETYLSAI